MAKANSVSKTAAGAANTAAKTAAKTAAYSLQTRERLTANHHAQASEEGEGTIHINCLMPFASARDWLFRDEQERLHNDVRKAITPKSIIEDHACDVIAELIAHMAGLERCRLVLLERARSDAIIQLLLGRLQNVHGLVHAMLGGDAGAAEAIETALSTFGIPEEAIVAQAYLLSIDECERLARLSAQFQFRIDLMLRQIERRKPMIASEIKALGDDPQLAEPRVATKSTLADDDASLGDHEVALSVDKFTDEETIR